MSELNKVYFFYPKDGCGGGYYVAGKNFKEAKSDALCTGVCDFCDNPFIDIRGHIVRFHYADGEYDEKGQIVRTEHEGVLNVKQMAEIGQGLLWFGCLECGNDDFDFSKEIDGDYFKYKCKNCGHEDDVPYIDI